MKTHEASLSQTTDYNRVRRLRHKLAKEGMALTRHGRGRYTRYRIHKDGKEIVVTDTGDAFEAGRMIYRLNPGHPAMSIEAAEAFMKWPSVYRDWHKSFTFG